ncbi:MAG: Stp1/IreP family PP2C-type Ser/Thr phosphatase [Lachnospiraceae bacterium]|nr:Stp1/IreP family PP2C-type Ser/Thr phosphatase [Lachnospiraceae bacterium]
MLKAVSITDIGRKRQLNEDCICNREDQVGNFPNLFIVADGMGGHKAGDHASRETVEILTEKIGSSFQEDPKEVFLDAIKTANLKVYQDARRSKELEGMGTTVVACMILEKRLFVMNIGDSRLYVINEAEIRQITVDHSLVEEMVREGILAREKARNHPKKNIITRAVGVAAEVKPDFYEIDLKAGDKVLMCSDGLSNMLEDETIRVIVNSIGALEEKTRMLVDAANGNGGKDNISVILIDPFAE